jgi:hypothetical protein
MHPEMWLVKEWTLLHDNALACWPLLVQLQLTRNDRVVFPHPLFCPILELVNFYLFVRTKNWLKGCHF